MRKIKLLFCLLSILFIYSSCSSDDNEENPTINSDSIIGTWKLIEYNANLEATNVLQGQVVSTSTAIHEGNTFNAFTEFSENPNISTNTGNFINHITTTSQGQTVEQDFTIPFQGTVTWSIDGDQLTSTGENQFGETETYNSTILELNETVLKFRLDVDTEITIQSLTQTNVGQAFYTYEKQ